MRRLAWPSHHRQQAHQRGGGRHGGQLQGDSPLGLARYRRIGRKMLSAAGQRLRSQEEKAEARDPAASSNRLSADRRMFRRLGRGGSGTATIPSSRGRFGGVAGGGSAVGRFVCGAAGGVRNRASPAGLRRLAPVGIAAVSRPASLAALLHRSLGRQRHDHDLSACPATNLPACKLCVNVEHVAGRTEEAKDHLHLFVGVDPRAFFLDDGPLHFVGHQLAADPQVARPDSLGTHAEGGHRLGRKLRKALENNLVILYGIPRRPFGRQGLQFRRQEDRHLQVAGGLRSLVDHRDLVGRFAADSPAGPWCATIGRAPPPGLRPARAVPSRSTRPRWAAPRILMLNWPGSTGKVTNSTVPCWLTGSSSSRQ